MYNPSTRLQQRQREVAIAGGEPRGEVGSEVAVCDCEREAATVAMREERER